MGSGWRFGLSGAERHADSCRPRFGAECRSGSSAVAVGQAGSYEVFPEERFVSAPAFPEFRVIAGRDADAPIGAWDNKGNDVLPLISKRDRQYVTDFEELPVAGFAKLHWIELGLGA